MFDEDLSRRVRRLVEGERRIDDLDRIYLGQRGRTWNSEAVREVGDFVAHREERNKGLVTQAAKDVFTSVDVWSMKLRGLDASWADLARAGRANLRLATDAQLRTACGCGRVQAAKRLKSGLEKVDRKERISAAEEAVLLYLTNSFIWRPAFSGEELFAQLTKVLRRNGLLPDRHLEAFAGARSFVVLHALAVMHGSTVALDSGPARLLAGYANRHRLLEVKVEITFRELGKPLMTPVCLFLTDLSPEAHCEPELMPGEDPVLADQWDFPIEVTSAGRLARLG